MRYQTFSAFVAKEVVHPQLAEASAAATSSPAATGLPPSWDQSVPGQTDMFGNVWTNVNVFSPAEIAYLNVVNAGGSEASAITAGQAQAGATISAQQAAQALDSSNIITAAQAVLPPQPDYSPIDQGYVAPPISYVPTGLVDASGQTVTTPGPEFGVPPSVNPAVLDPVTSQLYPQYQVPVTPQSYAVPIIGLVLAGVVIWYFTQRRSSNA